MESTIVKGMYSLDADFDADDVMTVMATLFGFVFLFVWNLSCALGFWVRAALQRIGPKPNISWRRLGDSIRTSKVQQIACSEE